MNGFIEWIKKLSESDQNQFSQNLMDISDQNIKSPISIDTFAFGLTLTKGQYEELQDLCKQYQISYLAGNNSRNFKLSSLVNPEETMVLKLENRLGNPFYDLKIVLSSTAAANMLVQTESIAKVTVVTSKKMRVEEHEVVLNLQVQEYCSGMDLETIAYTDLNPEERLKEASQIFSQMVNFLMTLNDKGFAHPDLKNSNWLLTDDLKLKVSDTKAIIPAISDNIIIPAISDNIIIPAISDNIIIPANTDDAQGYRIIDSKDLSPPELIPCAQNGAIISANRAMSYMVGRNIYEFLYSYRFLQDKQKNPKGVGLWKYIKRKRSASDFDFDDPVFGSPIGEYFKDLILKTVREDPQARLSLAEIKNVLDRIQIEVNIASLEEVYDFYDAVLRDMDTFQLAPLIQPLLAAIATVANDEIQRLSRGEVPDLVDEAGIATGTVKASGLYQGDGDKEEPTKAYRDKLKATTDQPNDKPNTGKPS